MIIYDNLKISDIQNSVGEDYISFRKKLIIKPVILAFDVFLPWFMIIISILFLDQIDNKKNYAHIEKNDNLKLKN